MFRATATKLLSAPSAARQVLQTRALQCSFSSVFHLRKAGMNPKEAQFVENLFVASVGVPLAVMAVVGLVQSEAKKE